MTNFRFSLKTLFFCFTAACIIFTFYGFKLRSEQLDQAVLSQLKKYGANAGFRNGRIYALEFSKRGEIVRDEQLRLISELSALEILDLSNAQVTIEAISELRNLDHLHTLQLDGRQFTVVEANIVYRNRENRWYALTIGLVEIDENGNRSVVKNIAGF